MSTQALAVCPYLPKSEREDIVARIVAGKRLQRKLPFGGELRIERPLPFLVVVRVPPGTEQLAMHSFVSPQASYLIAPEDGRCRESYSELIGELASGLLPMFGSFLLIELWAGRDKAYNDQPSSPAFTIHARKNTPILATVNSLKDNLALISSQALSATVNVSFAKRVAPPGFKELLLTNRQAPKVRLVGVELSPSWVNALTGHRYELLRRSIVRQFSRALRRTLFQFTSSETTYVAEHYHSLGPRNLTKAVKRYDELIAEVGRSFDFLLQLSPINIEEAWAEFRRAKYAQQPQFRYRPINVDPGAAKAKLFSVAVEEIEDPTLARLYRAKRAELEQKLTTLANRNSKKAFYSNLLIYSEPSEELVALADRLLTAISPRTAEGKKADEVSASEMAKRARKEIAAYKKQYPEVPFQVELTSEIASTIMVSKKRLLIHKSATFPKRRVEALIQH